MNRKAFCRKSVLVVVMSDRLATTGSSQSEPGSHLGSPSTDVYSTSLWFEHSGESGSYFMIRPNMTKL